MAEGKENENVRNPGHAEDPTAQEQQEAPHLRWRKRPDDHAAQADGDRQQATQPDAAGLTDEQRQLIERTVQERVAAEQARAEEALARVQRVQADFVNYKRRSEQEREGQARFAAMVLVKELLPVLDNFDRALATMPEEVKNLPWTEGLLLVDRQLRATLEKQGLKPIEAVGARFDPMLHEAIIHEESSDHADDEVIAELQRGYMLHDKVVRPTLVTVAKNVAHA
jgi:molecular chaperone GrpE